MCRAPACSLAQCDLVVAARDHVRVRGGGDRPDGRRGGRQDADLPMPHWHWHAAMRSDFHLKRDVGRDKESTATWHVGRTFCRRSKPMYEPAQQASKDVPPTNPTARRPNVTRPISGLRCCILGSAPSRKVMRRSISWSGPADSTCSPSSIFFSA